MGVVSPMHDGSSHLGSSNFGSSHFGSIDFGSSNLGSSQSFQRACYGPAFPCFANKVRGSGKAASDPMGQHLLRITQSSRCVPMPLHLMRYKHPSGLRLLCRSEDCRRTAIHRAEDPPLRSKRHRRQDKKRQGDDFDLRCATRPCRCVLQDSGCAARQRLSR